MLKKEVIKANAVLSSLTDEQLAAIEQLSENDENAVIGQKVGEIHRQYDETILKATGVQRNGDEKSYVYLERAAAELKKGGETLPQLQQQIQTLTNEKKELEKQIASGNGDAALKTQLQNTQAELEQTKNQFTELQTKYQESEKGSADKLFGMRIDHELSQATTGLKFKPELPESATKVLLSQALDKIKANSPDFIDDGNGGQRLVFRNKDGAVLNNPENKLNPYSASELLTKELRTMGVLDEGRKGAGGGTGNPGNPGGKGQTVLDVSGARSKIEATETITKHLLGQGLTKGSEAFDTAMSEAWKENNVSELPEK